MKEFKKYKAKFLRLLGNHELSNTEIDEIAINLFGKKYKGSYAQNEKFTIKEGYYVINTDLKNGSGIHWVALILTQKNAYFYDSFGRNPYNLVPYLTKRLRNYNIKFDKMDAEQKATYKGKMTVNCGHSSLAFLLYAKNFGVLKAIKI